LTLSRKDAAATNPRGIPYAPFVDKVEDYVTSRADVEATLKSFQEMIAYAAQPGLARCQLTDLTENTSSWRPTNNDEQPA